MPLRFPSARRVKTPDQTSEPKQMLSARLGETSHGMIKFAAAAVQAHFEAHMRRSKRSFFWRVTLEGLIVPLGVLGVMKVVWDIPRRDDLDAMSAVQLVTGGVVFAPVVETLLLHAIPVHVARRFQLGFWWQVVAGLVLFAILHFPSGVATGVCAGVVSGFYWSFTYVHWRRESFRSALWMTAGSHAVHNLLLLGVILVERAR